MYKVIYLNLHVHSVALSLSLPSAGYTSQLPVDVTITPDLATPTAGQPLTMTCSQVTRNPLPQTPVSYQWLDSSGAVLSNSNTLSFTTLRQSHQGEYFCVATVDAVVGCAEYSIVVQGGITVVRSVLVISSQ